MNGVDGDPPPSVDGTSEITGFVRYSDDGFAAVLPAPERGEDLPPRPASSRGYLRQGLPAIYHEDALAMGFVGALEEVLDPIVGLLDALPSHFDPELAPLDVVELLLSWVGLRHNESAAPSQIRNLLQRSAELGRFRGTYRGVVLSLELYFPELPLRVEDGGGVRWRGDELGVAPGRPNFVVYCDAPISREQALDLARVIETAKPAHVGYRLRIKGRRRDTAAET